MKVTDCRSDHDSFLPMQRSAKPSSLIHLYILEHWTDSCSVTRSVPRGAVFHQFPSRMRLKEKRTTIEKMDMTVVSMPTLTPLVCSDLKVNYYLKSENETVLYAVNCVNVQRGDLTWPLVLGISGTLKTIALYCLVPIHKVMWRTKIFECVPESVRFLCTTGFW